MRNIIFVFIMVAVMSLSAFGQNVNATVDHCPKALQVTGSNSTTGTGDTAVTGTASGTANVKTYIYSVQVVNTGSTTSLITFKDASSGNTLSYTIAPTGSGSNIVFEVPIATAANTALFFAAASASTTIYVSAQGCKAP